MAMRANSIVVVIALRSGRSRSRSLSRLIARHRHKQRRMRAKRRGAARRLERQGQPVSARPTVFKARCRMVWGLRTRRPNDRLSAADSMAPARSGPDNRRLLAIRGAALEYGGSLRAFRTGEISLPVGRYPCCAMARYPGWNLWPGCPTHGNGFTVP